jgi:hypothetical protein
MLAAGAKGMTELCVVLATQLTAHFTAPFCLSPLNVLCAQGVFVAATNLSTGRRPSRPVCPRVWWDSDSSNLQDFRGGLNAITTIQVAFWVVAKCNHTNDVHRAIYKQGLMPSAWVTTSPSFKSPSRRRFVSRAPDRLDASTGRAVRGREPSVRTSRQLRPNLATHGDLRHSRPAKLAEWDSTSAAHFRLPQH